MECNGFSFPSTMSSTISIYILSSSFTISCVTSMHMHSMQKIHIITPRWHNIQCMFGIQVMPSIQAPNRTTFKSWISLFRKYEGRLYVAEKSKWVCQVRSTTFENAKIANCPRCSHVALVSIPHDRDEPIAKVRPA